ncbi:MAG: Aminodeoxychorismate lyase [Candidatus Gottesmanbacteria bacterium GW2011_GWA1_43_11]|uniref:Endolytic murein transglycosylase n=1 Tax=Candidatus Gottesmanbacteria bacterium GW2011_GWA1_43_11 TaxID=1618436 RepID=A0A0G1CGK7_9BACT|nr:MAG: Aminodeoxychorismate lyase [Candidatus Gottesmanbacteria bacterium GW2011_GWA1_43_11]
MRHFNTYLATSQQKNIYMTHKFIIRFVVFGILLLGFVGGGVIWWLDAVSAVNPGDAENRVFAVSKGEDIRSLANRLKAEGLIKNQIAFFLYVKFAQMDQSIQAGDFRLTSAMDMYATAQALTHGSLDIWVTLLEGWRIEEIAMKLAQELAIPEAEFLKVAREGYMFPDTYLLPREATASGVVEVFEKNFNDRVTTEIRQGIENQDLTFAEGIILASIVEREGKTELDRPVIAGILLNRLRERMPLQTDATLQYVLGYQSTEKSWWKKTLFNEDKEVNSPFNTYAHVGLPPAPISNPGLAALSAVATPTETDYLYYLHDGSGVAHYARTLDEHNANVNTYLQQ